MEPRLLDLPQPNRQLPRNEDDISDFSDDSNIVSTTAVGKVLQEPPLNLNRLKIRWH